MLHASAKPFSGMSQKPKTRMSSGSSSGDDGGLQLGVHSLPASRREPAAHEKRPHTEEALQFVRALAAFAKPILVLSGGEPLFRPDIFQIAMHGAHQGMAGSAGDQRHVDDERVAHAIVDSGIQRVAISIDGADEITHDSFRRQPGSLAAAVKGFCHLRRLG